MIKATLFPTKNIELRKSHNIRPGLAKGFEDRHQREHAHVPQNSCMLKQLWLCKSGVRFTLIQSTRGYGSSPTKNLFEVLRQQTAATNATQQNILEVKTRVEPVGESWRECDTKKTPCFTPEHKAGDQNDIKELHSKKQSEFNSRKKNGGRHILCEETAPSDWTAEVTGKSEHSKKSRELQRGNALRKNSRQPTQLFDDASHEVTRREEAIMQSLTEEDIENLPEFEYPFLDFMEILARAGDGGWHLRGKLRPKRKSSGPAFGGDGGDIIMMADKRLDSFLHIKKTYKTERGGNATEHSKGRGAEPSFIKVPLGTILRVKLKNPREARHHLGQYQCVFWRQFLKDKEQLLIAQGGRGSVGNSFLGAKDSSIPGVGEKKLLQLELRLMNDLFLIGKANSGRTSIAASITRYYGQIGPEPGTTIRPRLATLQFRDGVNVVLCDTPPISAKAAKSTAGRRILRHGYRAKALAYVIPTACDSDTPEQDLLKEFEDLRNAARKFHPCMSHKREMVIATKCDMLHRDSLFNLDSLCTRMNAKYPDIPVVATSARFGLGLDKLVAQIRQVVYPDLPVTTRRIFQAQTENIESLVSPTPKEIETILKELDPTWLPPVPLPSPDSSVLLSDPPMTQLHGSFKLEYLPRSTEAIAGSDRRRGDT